MLINGNWTRDWHPVQASDRDGRFVRQTSSFRSWITPDGQPGPTGDGGFHAEPDRYRLYVALICPWASRVLMARVLKSLEALLPVTVVEPFLTEQGWGFGAYPGSDRDPLYDAQFLHELYTRADPHYTGRATVPVLWDTKRETIVNNESADILRMLDTAFRSVAPITPSLYPDALADDIDAFAAWLYPALNNGVYQAGFASSQTAYEEANRRVFDALDKLEARFADSRDFVHGSRITESDVRLFVTLVRFDAAYHTLFKTNRRHIADYVGLQAFVERLLALPGIANTVSIKHIKAGYFSIRALNPSGIVPAGPHLAWDPATRTQ
ncbi:MAG: glutathione S-transferase C-terminal domain-containing protein [Pseudomonadota bacterium]